MKCTYCGALLPEGARFCPVCGRKTPLTEGVRSGGEEAPDRQKEGFGMPAEAEITYGQDVSPDADDLLLTADKNKNSAEEEREDAPRKEERETETEGAGEAFAALRFDLTETAGSGVVCLTAVMMLCGILAEAARYVYSCLGGGGKADFASLVSNGLPFLLVLFQITALFIIYGCAHRKLPFISTEALGVALVVAVIRAVVAAAGLFAVVILGVFLVGVALRDAIPIMAAYLPFGDMIIRLAYVLTPLIGGMLILELIYQIKLAVFLKNVSAIANGRFFRPRTGYLGFYNGILSASFFLRALMFAAMIFSGEFIVSFVRSLGYGVTAEIGEATRQLAPILFGLMAAMYVFKAAERLFVVCIFRRAAHAVKGFLKACEEREKDAILR